MDKGRHYMRNRKSSVDASYLRKRNMRLILDAVSQRETTSRAELAKLLNLSKPAISDNLSVLLEAGIIEEIGEGAAAKKGGRKPLLLKLNGRHRHIVVVDLSYSNPVVVLGNLKNEIVGEIDIRLAVDASPAHYASIFETGIDRLLRMNSCGPDEVFCIAVSLPGVLDAEGNIISQNPGYGRLRWNESNLRGAMQKRYNVEMMIKNDIRAAALGEWAYGAGRGEENLLYISCGAGLGAGIILNSALYEGARSNAGEIYYYLDSCNLESAGTMEDRICMKRLIESCAEDVRAGVATSLSGCNRQIGFAEVAEAYLHRDAYVCRKVEQICAELCTLAFNLGNFLALDKVVFGGEYAVFGETMLAEYQKRFQPRLPHGSGIELAALGKYSGVHGMLYTAKEAYFDRICSQRSDGSSPGAVSAV